MGERQFGPYRLVQQIAVGGMAEIHLAKTSGVAGFEKYVALKMIHPNFSQDEQFVQMLIDEAKITVQLQHANVAQTFDLGRVGDTFYLTMEFVDGVDLFSLLRESAEKERAMPFDVAAHVGRCVANGLDYAHRKRDHDGRPLGIVHRDVSPQNVLLSHSGEIKLVDFGIAKASHRARQTEAGVIKGKYYYMSPEQALAEKVDQRSDIFSTGILLHEMITGQMLYMEDDLQLLLARVRKADIPRPSEVRKDVPPQLEQIVMRALAKRPEDRYQTAGAMSSELGKFLHSHSPVFTASKVASYIREVHRGEVPAAPAAAEPSAPAAGPGRVTKEQLLREPSEFFDENSVIFRVQDLVGAPGRGRAPAAGGATGAGKKPPAFARNADVSTKLLDPSSLAAPAEDDEHTVISGPPQFVPEDAGQPPSPTAPPRPPGGSQAGSNPPSPAKLADAGKLRPGAEPPDAARPRPESRSGNLPLAPPDPTDAHPPLRPLEPASPGAPAAAGGPAPSTSSTGLAPEAVFGAPPGAATPTPYPSASSAAEAPVSLAPNHLRSPLVIASLAILALATIGAIIGGIFVGDDSAAPAERMLNISSIPSGARVTIDGESLDGETPVSFPSAVPGSTYVIEIELEGYETWTREQPIPERGVAPVEIVADLDEVADDP